MFNHVYRKGVAILGRALTGNPGTSIARSVKEMIDLMGRYHIVRPGILWDGCVQIDNLLLHMSNLQGAAAPIYTFSLDAVLDKKNQRELEILAANERSVQCDGWIVASGNPLDQASMAGFLHEHGWGHRIILNYTRFPESTTYYSYVDWLGADSQTLIHINNYFLRSYGYPFPLPLRTTLRDCDGSLLKARQVILLPDRSTTITRDFFQKDVARGYVEVEFEIHRKMTPFLHYMVDYINQDHLLSNHQSGLGLHAARSHFTRGYVPTSSDESLEICLYQKDYAVPPEIRAILKYAEAGQSKQLEAPVESPAKNQISWIDVRDLFPKVDFTKVDGPTVEIECASPLHRPNYYYKSISTGRYFDTSHAGADTTFHVPSAYRGHAELMPDEQKFLEAEEIVRSDLRFFVLPAEMKIDSIAGIGNDTTLPIYDFTAKMYSPEGKLEAEHPVLFRHQEHQYINLTEQLHLRDSLPRGGCVSLVPSPEVNEIPIVMNGISGFQLQGGRHMTTTAASGSMPDNIPFYFRGGPPHYTVHPTTYGVTEIFSRAIRSKNIDTILALVNLTASTRLARKAVVDVQVLSRSGEQRAARRTIEPNGTLIIRLSELIRSWPEFSGEEFFTIWVVSTGIHLYGQHLLLRDDGAISVEHCYVGKFGY